MRGGEIETNFQASKASFNGTGVAVVDSLITAISRKTVDVLHFFNLVS